MGHRCVGNGKGLSTEWVATRRMEISSNLRGKRLVTCIYPDLSASQSQKMGRSHVQDQQSVGVCKKSFDCQNLDRRVAGTSLPLWQRFRWLVAKLLLTTRKSRGGFILDADEVSLDLVVTMTRRKGQFST